MSVKKKNPGRVRTIVFLCVVALVAVGYFTTIGIGNVSALGFDVWSVLCPLGYLESLLAGKMFIPRALVSFIAVVALVVLLGRVFCAWVCPMPHLQKWLPGPRKLRERAEQRQTCDLSAEEAKALGKPRRVGVDSRVGVLVGALASAAIFGFPVFCLVCPVGLGFATVFLIMRLFAYGEVTWTVVVVPLVLLAEVLFARKWCHKFCPLGALMSLLSGANRTLRPSIDDTKCIHTTKGAACFACSKACPEKLDIRRPEASERALSNCTKCKECQAACPAAAITFPLLPKREDKKADEVK